MSQLYLPGGGCRFAEWLDLTHGLRMGDGRGRDPGEAKGSVPACDMLRVTLTQGEKLCCSSPGNK